MWLIGLRDLQWRRRRFTIAVLATGLVLALTLLLDGVDTTMRHEPARIVRLFGVDAWIVTRGSTGPFTAAAVVPESVADEVARDPGVVRADPIVTVRSTLRPSPHGQLRDVNVIGYRVSGIGAPTVIRGRTGQHPGEVVTDRVLDLPLGRDVTVGGHHLRVVGVADDVSFYFGTPTIFVPAADAQAIVFAGQPLATAIVTRGTPQKALPGLEVLTGAQVRDDLKRPMRTTNQTLALIDSLLWLVAAGIVGSIVYLSALERVRDFAVLKATGTSTSSLVAGLAMQALVLTAAATLVAVGLAYLLAPTFPFQVTLQGTAFLRLTAVALVIGLVASLAGLRHALRIDPALAFGGA
jgi:putative ABC transport system permease protein